MKIRELQDQGIIKDKVIPTTIEGIFVRNLKLQEVKELQDALKEAQKAEDDPTQVVAIMIDIIRDAAGEPFEDMVDPDQVLADFGMNTILEISQACFEAVAGGKLAAT